MPYHDFPPPPRPEEDDDDGTNHTNGTRLNRKRHISMQSMVDSIAHSMYYQDDLPGMQAAYQQGRFRSTSGPMEHYQPGTPARSLRDYDSMKEMELDYQSPGSRDEATTELIPKQPLQIPPLHEALFIAVAVLAQFMALAGLGQGIAPQGIISEDLGVYNPGEQAWFTAAFSLTVGTFILVAGRIGDILGHKRVFVFGYFFLGAWSGFAGFSSYVGKQIFFDVCRAMQGIGAALLAPNALALLGRAYPAGMKKNLVFALFGAMAPWGFVIGALMASVFSELTWWPWTFWSYGIAAWGLAFFSWIIVPRQLNYEAQFRFQPKKPGMDWTGCLLGVCGLVLFNIAWNNAPLYGWNTPHVYFVLILGLLTLVAFIWVEARAVSPLLPVKTFNGTVGYTMALVAVGWSAFGIWVWYSWRFLMELRDQSPLTTSYQFTPALVCGLLAAGVTGFMLTHTPVSFVMMLSMVGFLIGSAVGCFQPVDQSYWPQMFVSVVSKD